MAGTHLDDFQLLDLAMAQPTAEEADAGRDHCLRCPQCRERLEGLRPLAEGFGELSEAEDVAVPSAELWRQLSERAEPVLEELGRRDNRPAAKRPVTKRPVTKRAVPSGRLLLRRSWVAAASVLLLVGAAGGVWFFWSNMATTARAAVIETVGPVKITRPGQPSRDCRSKGQLVRVGDILSTPDADGAIRLECATRLAMRRGCRLEAQSPDAEGQATFMLWEGSLCVETTRSKQGCCVKTPVGTVRCWKGKTLVRVTSPEKCTVTPLEGEVEMQCGGGHGKVVSPGVCAELKRSEPCCYRPARPEETRCDWVDRCGKPKDRRKKCDETGC